MATIGAPADVDSDLTSQTDSMASANGIDHASSLQRGGLSESKFKGLGFRAFRTLQYQSP